MGTYFFFIIIILRYAAYFRKKKLEMLHRVWEINKSHFSLFTSSKANKERFFNAGEGIATRAVMSAGIEVMSDLGSGTRQLQFTQPGIWNRS